MSKEKLSIDDNRTYANCLNEIKRKSIEVEDLTYHLNCPWRSNQARARNNTNNKTNHQTKTNNNDGQVKIWQPKEEWNNII